MKENFCYLLLVLRFLPEVFSTPLKNEVSADKQIIRTAREIQDDLIAIDLEKYIATIPFESFVGDYFLIQFADVLNGVTTFRHVDPLRQEFAVYNTEYNEKITLEKEIYVLRKNEDKIRIFKNKRTYVVLRRFQNDKRFFYISNLYLKKPSGIPNSKSVELGGEKFYIEWDMWEHRGGNENKAVVFGQVCCKSSMFVSCQNNDTIDFPKATTLSLKGESSEPLNFVAGKIALSNGDDVDEDMDFFYDLDDDTETSRYVGSKVFTMLRSVSSIKGRAANANTGKPAGLIPTMINAAVGIVNQFVEIGMGLLKSFGGLFGGLGTNAATTKSVFAGLQISNHDIFEERVPDNINAQIDVAVKIPGSGGLGGFINKNEEKEKPEEVPEAVFEKDYDPSGRGLLDFLPERMKDPMTDEIVDLVVDSVLNEIDTFKHPGWKTLGKKAQQGVTLTHENDAFVGFGACVFNDTTAATGINAQTPEDIISALKLAIGTHCIKSKSNELSALITDGYLKLTEHQSLQLSENLPHLLDDKIPMNQTAKLLQAYEVSVFSEVYLGELRSPSKELAAPDGLPISRSVHTLGVYAKNSIITLKTSRLRKHCVKIRRNLAKTLKTFILKLLEDKIILDTCLKCKDEKDINYNDSVYLMGLIQFIFKGLGPVRKGEDIHTSFGNFYKLNKQVLEGKVKSYYN